MPMGSRRDKSKKAPMESGVNGVDALPDVTGIDALPDVVLQHILSFLRAQGAVRTCVLARRWRDLWVSMTSLRIISDEEDDGMEALREFVDHLLLLRGGAPIENCELRFGAIADGFSDSDVLRVNFWFRHAIRCQALRLVDTSFYQHFDLHFVSQHLMELELDGLEVKESFLNFLSCPALEQLEIKNCNLFLVKRISSESLKRLSITDCEFG